MTPRKNFTQAYFTRLQRTFLGTVQQVPRLAYRLLIQNGTEHRTASWHRRNLREVRGVRVPPTFWSGGYRTPHFLGVRQKKNNSDFPSSSAHESPYNIRENVCRLGLCLRNQVAIAAGARGTWKKLHNRFSCAKGTNIYVKVLSLVGPNCERD